MSLINKLAPSILASLNDLRFTQIQFLWKQRRLPNLKNPKTFNEKLQWLKLNHLDPLQVQCADKYAVREYVADKLGEKYLVPMLGIYRSVDEIDFEILPERFVLKGTHGSGWVIICRDKSSFDSSEARREIDKWLRTNFYRVGRERVYQSIPPGIIAEEFLGGLDDLAPPDYKIFCFNGRPKYIQMDFDRFTKHSRTIYDTEWNPLDGELEYPENPDPPLEPPEELGEMISISTILSKPFPFVRVDLYAIRGNIFFGELTFYPGKAVERFRPKEFDYEFGKELDLIRVADSSMNGDYSQGIGRNL